MKPRLVLGLLLFACVISVIPLAYASPPDPTWTEGIYDDADGDDVIVSLSWAAWVAELSPLPSLTPPFVAVPFAPAGSPRIVSRDIRRTPPGRAPPVA